MNVHVIIYCQVYQKDIPKIKTGLISNQGVTMLFSITRTLSSIFSVIAPIFSIFSRSNLIETIVIIVG